ncbi:MAG TPA: hypothetical protein VFX06_04480 [Stellaceae bacterium]|nr:hypothetical protein [Stellaceae bacterium]
MSAGALRRLALLAAMLLAIIGIAVPAGAAEPLGSKNFTAPRYAPDYFSSESAPFHTVPGAPRHATPQRYAAPAAPRYVDPAAPRYAAPVAAAAPSVRGASEARYRRTPIRANPGRTVRHAERRRARHRRSAYAARRLSHVRARARRHVHHRHAARRRAALRAVHAHRRGAAHHHRIVHTAGRNTGGRF